MINRVTTVAAPWRTLAKRDEPGRMSRTGVNRGNAVAISAHSVAPSCLYRDMPAAMKTPVLGR